MANSIKHIRQDDEQTIWIDAFDMTIAVYPDGEIWAMEGLYYAMLDDNQEAIVKEAVKSYLM